jgi:hypothetical protein
MNSNIFASIIKSAYVAFARSIIYTFVALVYLSSGMPGVYLRNKLRNSSFIDSPAHEYVSLGTLILAGALSAYCITIGHTALLFGALCLTTSIWTYYMCGKQPPWTELRFSSTAGLWQRTEPPTNTNNQLSAGDEPIAWKLQKNRNMNNVTLKNGTQAPFSLVTVISISLERLIKNDFICFYELVMKCRDSSHEFFGDTADQLKQYGLANNAGIVHQFTRNIVLSSVEGNGFDMTFSSPLAAEPEQR